ncbi:unnamed protein product [Clavelina lepadiformis]|uniref:Ankyrin repeat domain-containing protein 10 n=1 Tax=Clavelina lepadiformis TaxID=159417 RepID=A0ABP0H2T0_CLALP
MDTNNDTPLGFWGTESEEVIARQYPIHKACRDGNAVALSRLVAVATPDQMVVEDQFYGWTPLHWAAYFGKIDCLNGLLMTGVNVNIRTSRFQQTPAHISAFGGHPNCLSELIKSGADIHARDYLGEIPLHKASRVGNIECIRTLIGNGTMANICNNNGYTAGDLSRKQNFKACVALLEQACSHLPSPCQSDQHTNGFHHMSNGSSGSHLANGNGNGHTNGWATTNGINGTSNRKRSYNDESIPLFKRPRVAGDAQVPVKIHPNGFLQETFNDTASNHEEMDSMDNAEPEPQPVSIDKLTNCANGSFYSQYLLERQIQMYHGL